MVTVRLVTDDDGTVVMTDVGKVVVLRRYGVGVGVDDGGGVGVVAVLLCGVARKTVRYGATGAGALVRATGAVRRWWCGCGAVQARVSGASALLPTVMSLV